jgi:cell division protein FtsB
MARKKKKNPFNVISAFAVLAVIITLSIVTLAKGQGLQQQIDRYDVKIAEYQTLIEDENERTSQLEERKKYVQTKKYIEEVAKEKFGLLYEDEIAFKAKK